MSSFFTLPAAQRKRKRIDAAESPKKRVATAGRSAKISKPAPRRPQRDESISGSESESDNGPRDNGIENVEDGSSSGSDGEEETAAERRLRLAERYLDNIREEVDEVGFDAEDIDRDLIAERLKDDVAESKGKIYRNLASELSFEKASHSHFRVDSQTVTSIATCPPYAYTVSKDMCLTKWRIQDLPRDQFLPKNGKKQKKATPPPRRRPELLALAKGNKNKKGEKSYQGHVDIILCVAASQDGKFVATGGRDRRLIIWEAENLKPLRVFHQHRDAVTGLAFRRGTNQLYSSSKDRTIKIWSLDELAYVETLFGHQDEVVDIAALAQERCISVGARDRTARLWKVVEETQLVFRGGGGTGSEKKPRSGAAGATPIFREGSMDRVAMIDEEMFVTGSDNGSLSLWVTHKKKPIFTLPLAHGIDHSLAVDQFSAEEHPDPKLVPAPRPRWITALTTIPYSDVILSGSWDGHVRVWRVSADKKKIESVGVLGSFGVPPALANGDSVGHESVAALKDGSLPLTGARAKPEAPVVRGVINEIALFERGDRGKDGVCVVVAVGKEHRLGRWVKGGGKNGAVVFEVPRGVVEERVNGVGH